MSFGLFDDPRKEAALVLVLTLITNSIKTWSYLPYFPVEFSQMGWGKPGNAGGYIIMATGMSIAASIMFKYHVDEGSYVGCIGAVFMALLGIINGNTTPTLQTSHGVVALTCFITYFVYICQNGGFSKWLLLAGIAIILGHAVIFTQLDIRTLLKHGINKWPDVWTNAQKQHPIWVLQIKALCQWTMLISFFVSIFSIKYKVVT